MKNILIILMLFTLVLTACGNAPANTTQASTNLPTAIMLVIGTLQLEGTGQAVTAEQARELLPMWQVYQSLTDSSSAAQAEIDGLVEQIQETMTAEQMEIISVMGLTQQDVFAALQEQGGDFTQTRQSSSSSSTQNSGFTPPDDGGGMPGGAPPDSGTGGGAPPDGGMAGMGGAGPVASTTESQDAESGTGVERNAGVPAPLMQALIQILEQKAGS